MLRIQILKEQLRQLEKQYFFGLYSGLNMLSIEGLYKCMLSNFVRMKLALRRGGGGNEVSRIVEQ